MRKGLAPRSHFSHTTSSDCSDGKAKNEVTSRGKDIKIKSVAINFSRPSAHM